MSSTDRQDPLGPLTPAQEKRLAAGLSPQTAWPTLILAAALPLLFIGLMAQGLVGVLPLWVCALLLTPVSYAHYTLVHESVHGNLVPGHRKLRWVHQVVGWIGSLGLAAPWPVLNRTHVLHHAHTNTDLDPDIYVKGGFGRLIVTWIVMSLMNMIPLGLSRQIAPQRYQKLRLVLVGSEMMQATLFGLAMLVVLAAAIITGHLAQWFWLWFVPTRLGALLLNILFQWLPHYPFDRAERYQNTRISLWLGGSSVTLQQNLHLVHHLWPSVPFYNYGHLYRGLRPVLLAKGCRIEGLLVGAQARDRSA